MAAEDVGSSPRQTWVLAPVPPRTSHRTDCECCMIVICLSFCQSHLYLTPSSAPCSATYSLLNCITSPCLNFLSCRIGLITIAVPRGVMVRRDSELGKYILCFPMSHIREEKVIVENLKGYKRLCKWWNKSELCLLGERERGRTASCASKLCGPDCGDSHHDHVQVAAEVDRPLELQGQVMSALLELEHLDFIEEPHTTSLSL